MNSVALFLVVAATSVIVLGWTALATKTFQRKHVAPHCDLTKDQAKKLIRDLRVKLEWNKIMGSDGKARVELSTEDLQLLLECLEKSHER